MAETRGFAIAGTGRTLGLRDAVYVIFRRRFVIAAVALPIMLVASLGLFKQTGSYVAVCQVLVDLQSPEVPRWNTKAFVDYDRSLSTYTYMAMSVPVAEIAATALQDSLPVIEKLDNGRYAYLAKFDALTTFLAKNIDVSAVGESNILDLRFGSPNTRLSLMAVEACRNAFMGYSIRATKNVHAIEYYDEQVRMVSDDIASYLSKRAKIVSAAGYAVADKDMRATAAQLADMRSMLYKDRANRQYVEAKARTMRKEFDADPDYFPSPDRGDDAGIMVGAKDQVETIRTELNTMLTKYTPDNVEVQRTRERLEKARETLHREVASYIASYELEATALHDKEAVMQQQIAEVEKEISRFPDIDRQVTLLDSEISAKRELLKDLQMKRGEVQINAGADERISNMVKLTQPEIEVVISEFRKFAYFALISMFGVIFALVVGFVVDLQDHRLHTPERLEDQLGVPILGAVSDEGVGGAAT